MKIALVTCRELPEPDHDEGLLLSALAATGIEASLLAWDDPAASPGAFDACVLRSCWNYHLRCDDFLAWIDDAAQRTRLVNGRDVVHWNAHKRYLRELDQSGVPVVPTAFVDRGERVDVASIRASHGWDAIVIKPAVSAGSYQTRRFDGQSLDEAQRFAAELLAERDILVQRFMPGFDGERALVWIGGALSHAVIKRPRFADGQEQVSAARPIDARERVVAERALRAAPRPLSYARIDLIEDDGELMVSELELIEPSLFLAQHPPAVPLLIAAIGNPASQ